MELKKVFGTLNAGSVATSYTDYTFSLSDKNDNYTWQPGDGIGIVYFGGDSSNLLTVMRGTDKKYDETNTYHRYYTERWTNQLNVDLYMQLATDDDDEVTGEAVQGSEPKYVMIHFDDGRKSQFDHALPILNQYNIKATFWIVCDYASGTAPGYMRWSEIDQLVTEGHNIQNHGMSHKHLPTLSNKQLSKEIGDCKSIVMQHGSTGDVFAIPYNDGDDDQRVVTAISKFHNYGKGDGGAPQSANCNVDGCEILKEDDGTFNKDSKYAMKQWSHDTYSQGRTEAQIFDGFIEAVNRGKVDSNGNLVQFTIITYHKVNEGAGSPSSTLFEAEMRYLLDNGFTSLGMDDIMHDPSSERFKLR